MRLVKLSGLLSLSRSQTQTPAVANLSFVRITGAQSHRRALHAGSPQQASELAQLRAEFQAKYEAQQATIDYLVTQNQAQQATIEAQQATLEAQQASIDSLKRAMAAVLHRPSLNVLKAGLTTFIHAQQVVAMSTNGRPFDEQVSRYLAQFSPRSASTFEPQPTKDFFLPISAAWSEDMASILDEAKNSSLRNVVAHEAMLEELAHFVRLHKEGWELGSSKVQATWAEFIRVLEEKLGMDLEHVSERYHDLKLFSFSHLKAEEEVEA